MPAILHDRFSFSEVETIETTFRNKFGNLLIERLLKCSESELQSIYLYPFYIHNYTSTIQTDIPILHFLAFSLPSFSLNEIRELITWIRIKRLVTNKNIT